MSRKEEIIKKLQGMSGEYSVYTLFDDWIAMLSIAFAQAVDHKEDREEQYHRIADKYSEERLKEFCRLNALLVEAAEEKMEDILGYIYMHLEMGSNRTGQFFTPYHICRMMGKAALTTHGDKEVYTVNEPSCGGGGNIIGFAEAMKERGLNYQRQLVATCFDLDKKAVDMCYVQCSLYGIPAKVRQQDTLCDPDGKHSSTGWLITPGYILRAV